MKKKVKQQPHPVFSVKALERMADKAKTATKPFLQLKAKRWRSFKKSRTYHDYMEYVYGEPEE